KEACRDMNAGNSLEGTAFGKKVRKKRSRQPQKLLTRETSYMVFGRRPITDRATHSGPAYETAKERTVPRSAYQLHRRSIFVLPTIATCIRVQGCIALNDVNNVKQIVICGSGSNIRVGMIHWTKCIALKIDLVQHSLEVNRGSRITTRCSSKGGRIV